ncbi:N-formylglutamate amidohydrolase [bacterium]|nr:N-formylglutamate amidohydrolase [bacterium]
MKTSPELIETEAYLLRKPSIQSLPFVFASPHSGDDYSEEFLAQSRLDATAIRRSEDCFVHELFHDAPILGSPLMQARFPRAYLDPNREPYELDPKMFVGPLPNFVNSRSARVSVGLGTIARVVSNGAEIYRKKLNFAEVEQRIDRLYFPYHAMIKQLLVATRAKFGAAVLVDCHSMPSNGSAIEGDSGLRRCDFVLGDRFGTSCDPKIIDLFQNYLVEMGYSVARNDPYAGGFVTQNYGRPNERIHALQIEINRSLYMDELAIERIPEMAKLTDNLGKLISRLRTVDPISLRPPPQVYSDAAQ